MIIVGGVFEGDPGERGAFLARRVDAIRASRAEKGNLEYTIAADPIAPGRVVLFEKWESQADLDLHLDRLRTSQRQEGPRPTAAEVTVFEVTGERRLM